MCMDVYVQYFQSGVDWTADVKATDAESKLYLSCYSRAPQDLRKIIQNTWDVRKYKLKTQED